MPSDESKGSQLDAIGSLAQRQLDNTVSFAHRGFEDDMTDWLPICDPEVRPDQQADLEYGTVGGVTRAHLSNGEYGQSISGARVMFEAEDETHRAETLSSDGEYRIRLPIGRYRVRATYQDYRDYTTGSGFVLVNAEQSPTYFNIFLTVREGLKCPPSGRLTSNSPDPRKAPADGPPTVSISTSVRSARVGETFTVYLEGSDDTGLVAIWWGAYGRADDELLRGNTNCDGQTKCKGQWSAVSSIPGELFLWANARDMSYPAPGEAHQTSEGQGMACVAIMIQ